MLDLLKKEKLMVVNIKIELVLDRFILEQKMKLNTMLVLAD